MKKIITVCLISLITVTTLAHSEDLPDDLTELSLDALINVQVTSVSKKKESLNKAAAAVYVLSGDEIRRSGASSIPEALRMVPGVHVARIDTHTWAISARGFNGSISDKLEVLMDGRSLYTPFFSGVFWDAQDTYMEDIDRIEVIRGPGATLWGVNAVNGVINIVTKSSSETQGLNAYVGGGDELKQLAGLRYGSKLGDKGHWRAYLKTTTRDDSVQANGLQSTDGYEMTQGGFRVDWDGNERDSFTVQGDVYDSSLENPVIAPPAGNNPAGDDDDVSGYNLIGRWNRALGNGSSFALQLYIDHTERSSPGVFGEERDTYDLDFNHSFSLGERHEIVWGGGYRRSEDEQENPPVAPFSGRLLFLPDSERVSTYNLFVQDQIGLTDATTLTIGSKFSDNDYTGSEVLPSARLSWHPDATRTLWGAVSRAVRLPNRLDNDFVFRIEGFPGPPVITGNREFDSEEVIAYEIGYRFQPLANLSLDLALFYNEYDELRGVENGVPGVTPSTIVNNHEADSYGGELAVFWRQSDKLRVWAGYSNLRLDFEPKSGTNDVTTEASQDNDPRHQGFVRMEWDVTSNIQAGGLLRYVDSIENQVSGTPTSTLSSYTELDIRLAWSPRPAWEIAVVGQNLLDDSHAEQGVAVGTANAASAAAVSEVERGVYAVLTWRPGREE